MCLVQTLQELVNTDIDHFALDKSLLFVCWLQTLQELVNTGVQSEAPHQPQLVINPNWLTGAGTDSQEVWRALQSLGNISYSLCKFSLYLNKQTGVIFDLLSGLTVFACALAAVMFAAVANSWLTGGATDSGSKVGPSILDTLVPRHACTAGEPPMSAALTKTDPCCS